MGENEKDYALVRDGLDGCASRAEKRAALVALARIKQNREWEVKRAENNARAKALEAAREECAKIADGWAAYYPTDVFPEDSESLDAKSAAHGRRVAAGIAHDIRELGRTGHIPRLTGRRSAMKVGARVRGRDADGTVTKVEAGGAVVVRWDRAVHACGAGSTCTCGNPTRSRVERLPATRAVNLRSVREEVRRG